MEYDDIVRTRPQDLFLATDSNGNLIEISDNFLKIIGYTREETIGQIYSQFVHPEDLNKTYAVVDHHQKTGERSPYFENRWRHKKGGNVWFQWEGTVYPDGRMFAYARDITPLKEKEFFFEEMQKIANIGCWSLNTETNETVFSDETYRIHELEIGDKKILSDALLFYPQEVRGILQEKVNNLIQKKEPYDLELPFITAKGNHRFVRTTGRCIDKGGLKEVYGLIQDITEKYQAQKRIDLSKQAAKIGFWDWDVVNNKLFWDDSLKNLYGIPLSEVPSYESWEERLHPEDRKKILDKLRTRIDLTDVRSMELQYRIIQPDGAIRHIKSISNAEVDFEGRLTHLLGVDYDITEEVLKQEELDLQRAKNLNNSKFTLLGEMAANIAHEINNPLSLVMGRAEYLKTKIQSGKFTMEEISEGLSQIQRVSNRIAKIIKSHKTFSKIDPKTSFVNAQLKDLIDDSIELCSARLNSSRCLLIVDEVPNLEIRCRGSEVCQIFLNLISNSLEATEHLSKKWIKIKFMVSDKFVRIDFIDNGPGVHPSIQNKIMDPFFTTKENCGTGLGLSIANNIVKTHKGSLYYDNKKQNTTFSVELPYIRIKETEKSL